MRYTCFHCGEPAPQSHNYCSWDCHVAAARADGAVEHLPNGLPVACITADGKLLECEHGDHPTYLFPVVVASDLDPDDDPDHGYPQTHALVYTDGRVALTLHECCYALWSVYDGALVSGERQRAGDSLADASLAKIRAHVARALEDA
jgi:hypothetical protein